MKLQLSLRQSWTSLILAAVMIPTLIVMVWFAYQLYSSQFNSALQLEKASNEALRYQLESEFKRLKTVFHNKADPLSALMDNSATPSAQAEINQYLDVMVTREPAVQEVMIFSPTAEVIAIIDPLIGITKENPLAVEQLQRFKHHYGFNQLNDSPEITIPLLGRSYIGSPKVHDGLMTFMIAVPIGKPTKAVMVVSIDIANLWGSNQQQTHSTNPTTIRNYIVDRRGSLITAFQDSDYKVGDLITHLPIVRSALINEAWHSHTTYTGLNKQQVYGTITTIPSLNWTLVSEIIAVEITQPIWQSLLQTFVLILLGLLPFIGFMLWLAKKTITPINRLCAATYQIAQGNYHVAIDPCGIQELDVLALDFNLMAKARKKAEERLQLSDRVFRETHDGIMITDAQQCIIDVNPSFCEITGYRYEEIIGQNSSLLSSGKQSFEFYAQMWDALEQQGHWQGEIWNRKKNNELYAELLTISALKNEQGEVLYYVGIFSDITQSKQQQETLELIAHYDVLTQLPNRVLFADRFLLAIAHSQKKQSLLAICFLDLDSFKPINDNFGHKVGDQLLVQVAERIKACIREEDTISRQGGDEFALLLRDIHSYQQCEQILEKIHTALAQDYLIEGQAHHITASTGVTLYPTDMGDIDTLLRHADQAMYLAKQAGRNRFYLFNTEESQEITYKHLRLEEIQQALIQHEFCLYYQPKVNMRTGKVFGAEALIRWLHPEKGIISPDDFLPIIEGTELELQIGNWVISQALMQLESWHAQSIKLEISVNISSHHLQSPAFISDLTQALKRHSSVEPRYLELEILESSALNDLQNVSKIIKVCRDTLGINIALDDFGTGYSSLTHMRNLPANTIKIDQSFVRDMLEDPSDYAIIDGVIGLAESFGRDIIAEGVETTAHGSILLAMGCEKAQGYGIAKPMPAANIPSWLEQYTPNQEWSNRATQKHTLKERKIEIFKLTTRQWLDQFSHTILSTTQQLGRLPLLEKTECPGGAWIKRAEQEQLFDPHWLSQVTQAHDILHLLAHEIESTYQAGDREVAKDQLSELHAAFDAMLTVVNAIK
ncbi:MAG: EAL domain-containing protein [Methyloprofundus sp.]|nr:EAL domain-containing protein [Methyloprofundus sp.]